MIKKTLAIAASLFLLWSLVLYLLPMEWETGQTMRGDNLIRAEAYLYETKVSSEDVVWVGSSLSENLSVDRVNGRLVHNLGFGGQSALDGLDLVLAAPQLPGAVFVEMNILYTGGNSPLATGSQNPLVYWSRHWFPALRHRHQPVGVMKGWMLKSNASRSGKNATALEDRPLNAQSLALKEKEYADPPTDEALSDGFQALKKRIDELARRGVRLAVYETPIAPTLCDAPKAVSIREGYRKVFPVANYAYVEQPDCGAFKTTDGHHLGDKSISMYSVWLREELEVLLGD